MRSLKLETEFASWPLPERNHFLLHWCADKFDKEAELQTSRVVKTESYGKDEGVWMCWKEMVDKFDVEKAQGKKDYCEKTQFDSQGRPLHRPDRDSGLDTPGCREYHIYFDKDGKVESDQNRAAMAGDRQLEDAEDRKEVKEQLEDMVQAFGYNCSAPSAAAAATTQPPGTAAAAVVKIEPGTMASSSTGAEKGGDDHLGLCTRRHEPRPKARQHLDGGSEKGGDQPLRYPHDSERGLYCHERN